MTPEEEARQEIDAMLTAAGWAVQDRRRLNLGAALGVAVREFPLTTGEADYLLVVDRKAVGVVEAKPAGTTLSGVADQSEKYIKGLPANIPHLGDPLPFAYESTGKETYFRDLRDPQPRSRQLFYFHKPETLHEWASQPDTLRKRLKLMPPLNTNGLWPCQVEAIKNVEKSFAADHQRALIQMAGGAGKTFTSVSFIYRLIKFAGARRVLFLVDRSNLGRQARREFQQYVTPDDGRKFTELYIAQHLTSNVLDPSARVCITTIQRLYSMLKGEELDPELEEHSAFELPEDDTPKEVGYNPNIPIETFDFIITDECHRSIYNLWRQVLEYFDAYLIGLTATPSKQTIGFFKQNLVMEYSHERAVADGVNVGYNVYRIRTEITKKGSKVKAGNVVDKRSKLTREKRWERLNDDLQYGANELDRSVVSPSQIRTVVRTFRDKLFTEIFPGRTEVPKTLIFAKDDSHAEDIVHIVREEFGKGNDFCKKITYRTTGENPEDLIAAFRNSYNPRIAVTVDMIATGTDIRPLECLVFMRDIRSTTYFSQMKYRGTRTVDTTELQGVTPDARHKTHFVIVDCVDVCQSDKTDSRPLERKPAVTFDKLLLSVAMGSRGEDNLTSLAGRLARLDRKLEPKERQELKVILDVPMPFIINRLLDSVDPDNQHDKAKELFGTDEPTPKQVKEAAGKLAADACGPFDKPDFREKLIELMKRNEQVIDTVSVDTLLSAEFDEKAIEKAESVVKSFKKFIEDNKDELTAIQILYSVPYGKRRLTYEAVKQVAERIHRPPYNLTPEVVWRAYEQLDKAKVRKLGPRRVLTNIISLLRFALGEAPVLEPFPETEEERFQNWLAGQERAGKQFTPEQMALLRMIKDHIATSLSMDMDDFDYAPFHERGGLLKARQLFADELNGILTELNTVLAA